MEEQILTTKEKERFERMRQRRIRKIVMIFIPLILIIGGIAFGFKNYSQQKNQGTPKMEIDPLEYDAGTVSMAAGPVKKNYQIKNSGDDDLELTNVWTSCGCTTAVFKIGDKISPKFGMPGHGINPVGWSETLKPGERAELEVTFDTAFHGPQGVGYSIRMVYITTNDPQNKKSEVRLLANVVP